MQGQSPALLVNRLLELLMVVDGQFVVFALH